MRREHHEHLLLVTMAGFFAALIATLIFLYKPQIPYFMSPSVAGDENKTMVSDVDVISNLNSKIHSLEQKINFLSTKQDSQLQAIQDVATYMSTTSAQPTGVPTTKSIIAVSHTKGSGFTTSAVNYTPMGMYVNIRCPESCYLWISFYSSSQNTGAAPPQQGYSNSYGLFLNESDQGIYSEANFPTSSSSIPVSLNTVIPVGKGFYTIDIRAKTSGGTLLSNVSALQVMAIER